MREGRAMGSPLRLSLPGIVDPEAHAAWDIVRSTFAAAEADLGRFRPDSALSRLNAMGRRPVRVPRTLARALALAWRAFRMSRGAFDPRIIGALEAAGEHAGVRLPPSPDRLDPHDRWLSLDARAGSATITSPLDLGGIGKGLALRWAATALRHAGFGDFLVQAGGDLVASGRGPAARPWVVALDDPSGGGPLATIRLTDGAVATSSVAVRNWIGADGGLRHHLIDPATQRPAAVTWLSVTARHLDPAWAEVLSKVGFLAGDRIGVAMGGWPAWWVAPDGSLSASAAARSPSRGAAHARWYADSRAPKRSPLHPEDAPG